MSIFLYHVFLWFYKIGIRLVAPWNEKARAWLDGRSRIFERIEAEIGSGSVVEARRSGPVVWMHCSSLGEFEQGRPVIEALRRDVPGMRMVLTFFSPSGYAAKKDYAGADHIFFLPLDGPGNARRFIDLVKPSLVLWVKYDYWYYFLAELKKRNIPLLLVSGIFRADQPFFRWYGRLHRYMLECFTHLFVQTETSRLLLRRLRLTENVTVSGDTRFDRVIEVSEAAEAMPAVDLFVGQQPVIVAGSTWEEDEEEIDHYANSHPEIRFILAPHEISEDRLAGVERLFRHCIRYSSWVRNGGAGKTQGGGGAGKTQGGGGAGKAQSGAGGKVARPGWPEPNVLLIDNIGMLSKLYRNASVAYVGGGFGDDGVHNVLEAAVYGKPVVYGPVIEKYIEAVELTESGGGIVIDSAVEAEKVFDRLLNNEREREEMGRASREYVHSRKGATARVIGFILTQKILEI